MSIRGRRPLQALLMLMLSAVAVPVMASLIYTWQDSVDPDNVTGFIEFGDNLVDVDPNTDGIQFDPYADGAIVDFGFAIGADTLGIDDLLFASNLETDELGLCSPSCDNHGAAKIGAKKKTDYVFFSPVLSKKKSPYGWQYDGVVNSGKTAGKKEPGGGQVDGPTYFSGSGFWVLGGPVPVPEPGTLLLLLSGAALLAHVRRRLHARAR